MKIISPSRNRFAAFTLIELLVVIAIIGILAALIIGGAGIAVTKSHRSRAESERQALVTAIESYKAHKGFYPPDNTNSVPSVYVPSPLFYELTGCTVSNGIFYSVIGDKFQSSDIVGLFGQSGILNSTSDVTNDPIKNYFPSAGKTTRTAVFSYNNGAQFTAFVVPLPPGPPPNWTQISGPPSTPWNYNSSHPIHNPDSYDLWIDLMLSGKTNRISNWSKDPEVL